jgi:hypothetical protein
MFALDRYSGSESSCHCCQVKYICVLWQDTYNTAYEVDRKRALGIILSQSRQQDHEDAKVYISLYSHGHLEFSIPPISSSCFITIIGNLILCYFFFPFMESLQVIVCLDL